MSSRAAALNGAGAYFDSGAFARDVARRVAIHNESQDSAQAASLRAYMSKAPAAAPC